MEKLTKGERCSVYYQSSACSSLLHCLHFRRSPEVQLWDLNSTHSHTTADLFYLKLGVIRNSRKISIDIRFSSPDSHESRVVYPFYILSIKRGVEMKERSPPATCAAHKLVVYRYHSWAASEVTVTPRSNVRSMRSATNTTAPILQAKQRSEKKNFSFLSCIRSFLGI